jgi:hypothetical protein
METITVATSRGFSVSDMEVLVGGAIVIAALVWMVLSKMKQLRGRTSGLTPASNED